MPEWNLLEQAGYPQLKEITGHPDREAINEYRRNNRDTILKYSKDQGKEYFDGDRKWGFGGWYYPSDDRWEKVLRKAIEKYGLSKNSKVLIDRDEKGILNFILRKLVPGIEVVSVHCSQYPVDHMLEGYGKVAVQRGLSEDEQEAEEEARNILRNHYFRSDNDKLPFPDNYFDTVISIHSICNLPEEKCRDALRELIRVSKTSKNSYIQNDSWANEHERQKLMEWVLLCETFLDYSGWESLFNEEGYEGDWGYVRFT
jgi:hypothetical protein